MNFNQPLRLKFSLLKVLTFLVYAFVSLNFIGIKWLSQMRSGDAENAENVKGFCYVSVRWFFSCAIGSLEGEKQAEESEKEHNKMQSKIIRDL